MLCMHIERYRVLLSMLAYKKLVNRTVRIELDFNPMLDYDLGTISKQPQQLFIEPNLNRGQEVWSQLVHELRRHYNLVPHSRSMLVRQMGHRHTIYYSLINQNTKFLHVAIGCQSSCDIILLVAMSCTFLI